jgi:osmotically-inducible protein OsmY
MKTALPRLFALAALALAAAITSGCVGVAVVGAGATVVMLEDRRTTGVYVEDENIEWKALALNSEAAPDAHINTTSYNGKVLLTGEVSTEALKKAVGENIGKIKSVKSVVNELQVAGNSSFSSRGSDSLTTTKVKTAFLNNGKFPPTAMKVLTEDGTVYLMGLVTAQEGEAAGEIARNVSGVRSVVKVFEYIPAVPSTSPAPPAPASPPAQPAPPAPKT